MHIFLRFNDYSDFRDHKRSAISTRVRANGSEEKLIRYRERHYAISPLNISRSSGISRARLRDNGVRSNNYRTGRRAG